MTQVFISYSRKDIEFVERLASDLQSAGLVVWYDLSGLEGGTRWGIEIQSAIENSQFFLAVLSPNSLNSKWVQREFLFAESCNLKVIPLQYLPCRLPMWLLDLQLIDLQGKNYTPNFERLLKALGVQRQVVEPQNKVKVEAEIKDREVQQEKERRLKDEEQRRKQAERDEIKAKMEAEAIERQTRQEQQKRLKAEEQGRKQAEKKQRNASNRARRAEVWQKWKPRLPRLAGWGVLGILLITAGFLAPGFMRGLQTSPQPTPPSILYSTSTLSPETAPMPISGYKWLRPADMMWMMPVPAGNYSMGGGAQEAYALCQKYSNKCEESWFTDANPAHSVTLDEFWIDETEVTMGMYAKCVMAGICQPPENVSSYTRSNYYENQQYTYYPVIYVSWQDATEYCKWAGARLPSEAEWEIAARGGQEGRLFPWGNQEPDETLANYGKKIEDTTKVGSYPAGVSRYGNLDMAGNVKEWVDAWYEAYPGGDPNANIYFGQVYRVLRGGGMGDDFNLLATAREYDFPDSSNFDIGFRCERSLTETAYPTAFNTATANRSLPVISTPPPTATAFFESILDFIAKNTPTFEDDFSKPRNGWGNVSEGDQIFYLVGDGSLSIRDYIEPNVDPNYYPPDFLVPGDSFPLNGIFNASDFALQFQIRFGDLKSIGIQFRSSADDLLHASSTLDTGYRFTLYSTGDWDLKKRPSDETGAAGYQRINITNFNEVLLIEKGSNCSIFLNSQLLYEGTDFSTSHSSNRIVVYGNSNKSSGSFDNFKFWNLVGLDF
jgi:formylglycine-generating enzyme required for sulfatase activity